MNKEQILVLAGVFLLTLAIYFILKKAFKVKNSFVLINVLLIAAGIAESFLITSFLFPHDIYRNLPVFLIIPLAAFNLMAGTDFILKKYNLSKLVLEAAGFAALLIGSIIGGIIVDALGVSSFRVSDFENVLLLVFIMNTIRLLVNYSGVLKSLMKKQNEIKELKIKKERTEMQLEALQLKINPHFIYNSLNSIAALSTIDGEKTRDMTIGLSKLLRYSLMYQRNSFATMEEEGEIIKEYIEIEKIRFGEELQYQINLEDNTKKILIPRFILQPVVENCIKHRDTNKIIIIEVKSELKNNELVISVRDNGKPFPEKIQSGIGLHVVSEKLQLLFPNQFEMHIRNEPVKELVIVIKELKTHNG